MVAKEGSVSPHERMKVAETDVISRTARESDGAHGRIACQFDSGDMRLWWMNGKIICEFRERPTAKVFEPALISITAPSLDSCRLVLMFVRR